MAERRREGREDLKRRTWSALQKRAEHLLKLLYQALSFP